MTLCGLEKILNWFKAVHQMIVFNVIKDVNHSSPVQRNHKKPQITMTATPVISAEA